MTLSRQLIIAIFTVLLSLLVGSLYLTTESTKQLLLSQLQSHGQDAATHLGLYLAPEIQNRDAAVIEATVNAIFDSGFYQQIIIEDSEGNTLFSKDTSPRISDSVPEWFVSMVDIAPPQTMRDVTYQWAPVGSVHVQSRAGYAYDRLWQGVSEAFVWFVVLVVLAAAVVSYLLMVIMKPLRGVEEQAIALTERRYIEQPRIPLTRDLRRVVEAMNQMVRQVRLMFDEQSRQLEELRRTAYQDSLTGVANQRALQNQLEERLDYRKDFGPGTLIYLRINNLKELNESFGMEKASNFVKIVADRLKSAAGDNDDTIIGRFTGADFLLLARRTDSDALHRTLCSLQSSFCENYQALGGSADQQPVHIGVAHCDDTTGSGEVLSHARLALQESIRRGSTFELFAEDSSERIHSNAWHQHVADTINAENIFLQAQNLADLRSLDSCHQEVFSRIMNLDETPCSAGEFISVVKELGLMSALDRAVINRVIAYLDQHPQTAPLAVNLSSDALNNDEFSDWLESRLGDCPVNSRLHIEVSESAALNNLDAVTRFRNMLKHQAVSFGIDNFGIHPAGFSYLYTLQPDYLKIDGSLIRAVDSNAEDRFFVSSLITIAHSLQIKAYAEHVERESQLYELKLLDADGTQGYLHGQPIAL
ncbi:bifunctional diguanylate cyclase/phosphodiesterase [Marinobacterium jannaschii]|uniref:bifunctional diguanylate cyclase/phosphodiesterase n=1 Tax=Marinobacterium jannaschii TaxID=64970 RepID=UPI000487E4EC|nr:EAL domain-containing protein [Marinobacterium jannaschii]